MSLANGIGRRVSEGIALDVTNEQLANAANVTIFTTSRLTAEWQRTGAISKTRGTVFIRHPDRLI
jgi:CRP-like cAMP-binding protein